MKTKEFMDEIRERGFYFEAYNRQICVYSDIEHDNEIATIYTDACFSIDLTYTNFDELEHGRKEELFNLLVEYARTPIEERGEPKKYYLKHRWLKNEGYSYLNLDKQYGEIVPTLGTELNSYNFKTLFTQAEINDIKKRYCTELRDFEIIEVEE